jgi:hypothetical protein
VLRTGESIEGVCNDNDGYAVAANRRLDDADKLGPSRGATLADTIRSCRQLLDGFFRCRIEAGATMTR